jgi:predicted pyridoxine 5'-phosphate oxidase superfamily flavin-nucleotide-binding protein
MAGEQIALSTIAACFEGIIPAVIATASGDGTPNVTHLSRVHLVDDEHVALSNQFFSKTVRNLTENPHACLLLIDPIAWDEYRLVLRYERTERRGPVFDRLHRDVEAIAALTGMQGIFKLKSADVYRVVELDRVTPARAED